MKNGTGSVRGACPIFHSLSYAKSIHFRSAALFQRQNRRQMAEKEFTLIGAIANMVIVMCRPLRHHKLFGTRRRFKQLAPDRDRDQSIGVTMTL